MNIYDVSKEAGVSIATVSRVINNNSNVSKLTREKVEKVIAETGYTPNTFARGLGHNSMHTIGIMCADSSDPFIAKAIYHLEQGLRVHQYDVLLCCTGYDLNDKQNYLNLLLSKRMDAIILVGSNFVEIENEKNDYIKIVAEKVPIMILNASLKGNNIYSTLCDDYNAVFDATTALLNKGCKDIIYLYNSLSYSGNRKISGFLSAIEGIIPNQQQRQEHVHYITGNIVETKEYLLSLQQQHIKFDAVITSDDELAVGVLKYAKSLDIQVPKQLSIIGYNNSLLSNCSEPELTSIDNKLETLCSSCITTLMGIFNNDLVPIKTVYPGEIIKRCTTNF